MRSEKPAIRNPKLKIGKADFGCADLLSAWAPTRGQPNSSLKEIFACGIDGEILANFPWRVFHPANH